MRYPPLIAAQIAAFNATADCLDLAGANPSSDDIEAAVTLVVNKRNYDDPGVFLPCFVRGIRNILDFSGPVRWSRPCSIGSAEFAIFGSVDGNDDILYVALDNRLASDNSDEKSYFWRLFRNDGRLPRSPNDRLSDVEYPTLEHAISAAAEFLEADGRHLSNAA
jgi:hypothetical protein